MIPSIGKYFKLVHKLFDFKRSTEMFMIPFFGIYKRI